MGRDDRGEPTFRWRGGRCPWLRRLTTAVALLTLTAVSLVATSTPARADGSLASITVSPDGASVTAGTPQVYAVEGYDSSEDDLGDFTSTTTFTITPTTGGSTNGATCTNNSCTATVPGTYTITATNNQITTTTQLTVTAGPLASLVLDPTGTSITAGAAQLYTVEGYDPYTNDLGDFTSTTTFTITPTTGGSTNGATCTNNSCTATVPGTYTITATNNQITTTTQLTVTAGPFASLALSPPDSTVGTSGSVNYAAEGFDSYTNDLGDFTSTTTFTITPTTGGSTKGATCTNNSCTATVPGTYTITATDGSASTTTTLQVVADWAQFQHDAWGSRVSPDPTINTSSAPSLTPAWTAQIGNGGIPILATPAVAYNPSMGESLVYAIDVRGVAQAYDASTGQTVWQQALPWGVIGTGRADGDVSSPLVAGNTVYYGLTGAVVAMNATTGALECTFNLPVAFHEPYPGIVDSSLTLGYIDATGPTIFFGDIGDSQGAVEVHNRGHEWAITGVGNSLGGCQERWAWAGFKKPAGTWSTPALVKGSNGKWLLVFGSSNPDDSVYALNAETGKTIWSFTTFNNTEDEDVGAGPTVSPPGANGNLHGVVYVIGKDAIEYALDLKTGKELWSFNLAMCAKYFTLAVSSAALVGDTLYVPYYRSVYALNATTGALEWQSPSLNGNIDASASVAGPPGEQVLLIGTLNGEEDAISLANGQVLWSEETGQQIFSSTVFADGMAFFGTTYGYVDALQVGPGDT